MLKLEEWIVTYLSSQYRPIVRLSPLRFDIVLYLFGVVCFVFAAFMIPFFGVELLPVAFVIVFFLFGLFFLVFGYSTRPKHYKSIKPPYHVEAKIEEESLQQSEATKVPVAYQPPSSQQVAHKTSRRPIELTRIKGIGPKRIARLNALQIMSVEDLMKFSAQELAEKLSISSKTTAKWIEQAQNLLSEGT